MDFKFKIDENGVVNVNFDLHSLVYDMDEDEKNKLIEIMSWEHPLINKLVGNLKRHSGTGCVGEDADRIRELFFTVENPQDKDDIIKRMHETMNTILFELTMQKSRAWSLECAWQETYNAIKDKFGEDAYAFGKIFSNAEKKATYSEVSGELYKASKNCLEKEELIKSWTNKMIELFGNKKNESEEYDARLQI